MGSQRIQPIDIRVPPEALSELCRGLAARDRLPRQRPVRPRSTDKFADEVASPVPPPTRISVLGFP